VASATPPVRRLQHLDLLTMLFTSGGTAWPTAAGRHLHKIVLAEVRNFPELAQFYTDEVILPATAWSAASVQRGIDRGEFRPSTRALARGGPCR
jgi:hypothetical protein